MRRIAGFSLVFFLLVSIYSTGQDKKEKPRPGKEVTKAVHKKATSPAKKKKAHAEKPKHGKKQKVTKKPATKTKKPKAPPAGKSKGGAYSGNGFRVQIYNGPERGKAQHIRDEFSRHYPGVETYLSYIAPHYRVKVGDYKRKQDAMGMFREASSSYFPCMIVPDKVVIK